MKRVQLYLSEKQAAQLGFLAKEQGVSFAEVVRRMLDASPLRKELKRIETGRRILNGPNHPGKESE